jgi:hypothetical protein
MSGKLLFLSFALSLVGFLAVDSNAQTARKAVGAA